MARAAVTIIDLDIGNLLSVANAFRRVGAQISVATHAREVQDPRILVLPGVGAFERAMTRLHAKEFGPLLRRHAVEAKLPLIGICLGMQMLANRSFENGVTDGLGFISGEVVRLEAEPPHFRVPNIGWMPVATTGRSAIFDASTNGRTFYHVHSYHLVCEEQSDVAATVDFGSQRIVTAVERSNLFGVQFHPEKSQDAGLDLFSSLLTHLS
jgi:imidazole glycerol-phosphate synthase subunit HisH